MGKPIDVSGQRFGRLLTKEKQIRLDKKDRRIAWYLCLCDCGTECLVRYGSLQSGSTRSCGCLGSELSRSRALDPKSGVRIMIQGRKQPRDVIRLNALISYYKRNSKPRNLTWNFSEEEVRNLVTSPCTYCGERADWVGIDRVNNDLGYSADNCVSCCRWCNCGKRERTVEEFDDWVRRLYERRFYHLG